MKHWKQKLSWYESENFRNITFENCRLSCAALINEYKYILEMNEQIDIIG